ncbi:MAG: LPS export ABC transporter permease LptF [Gammaproteobacteria bacterium]|jgi:lipopolysaccharide export system permease protein
MIFMLPIELIRMIRVFDRYLLREVIHGWVVVTVILWLVLVCNRLVRYLGDAAAGEIPAGVVFKLLGLKMVWYLVHVVPFALALGVIIGLGRMYRDNEMTVMAACGVGPVQIYKPLLTLGAVVTVLLGWLSLSASPAVEGMSLQVRAEAEQQADFTVLGAGRFNAIQNGRLTFYAERLSRDGQQMENLFIVVSNKPDDDRTLQLLRAQSAYRKHDTASGDDFLVLLNGYRYEGTPGRENYRSMQFREYGIRIDMPGMEKDASRLSAMPTAMLVGSADNEKRAELQWRLAMPLSVMVLLFLSVPLCKSSPRQGRYGRLVIAILLFVVYYNLLGAAKVWVERGAVPVSIGLWWVPLLAVILALVLLNSDRLARRIGHSA